MRAVVVAADHRGYGLKESIKRHLRRRGYEVIDVGTTSEAACDYPVVARAAAEAVASGRAWRGVIVDGAGMGSCMVANKVPGVRAAMVVDVPSAKGAREHNDAHIMTLGAGRVAVFEARRIVDAFLSTDCTAERHRKRVDMIEGAGVGAAQRYPAPGDDAKIVRHIVEMLTGDPELLVQALGMYQEGGHGVPCSVCAACCGHCVSESADGVRSIIARAGEARVSSTLGIRDVPSDLAPYIDHTLLKPEATYAQIDQLCDEAIQYGFASVCVNPLHVARAAKRLRGHRSKVCTVIGFPLGATPRQSKASEARQALRDGADELDMVLSIGALKSGDHETVYQDVRLLAEVAHDGGATLKVILETCLLTDEEKVAASMLCKKARADFVKTSTGFSTGGATLQDVALMSEAVEHKLGVKASGGIRNAGAARDMIRAGATRLGASVGVKIVDEEVTGQASADTGSGY